MKYVITQKNVYEVTADSKEEAMKMITSLTPSTSVNIEEIKTTIDYSDLKNMMNGIKNITPNKIQKILDDIKNNITPRYLALKDLLFEGRKNGLRVNDYLKHPKRDYYFGIDGSLIYKTGAEGSDDKFWYIDDQGDVYTSNYCCNYNDGKLTFSDTFKVNKGSPEYEERNQKKLNRLIEIYDNFERFENEVINDIKNQLEYKLSQK